MLRAIVKLDASSLVTYSVLTTLRNVNNRVC